MSIRKYKKGMTELERSTRQAITALESFAATLDLYAVDEVPQEEDTPKEVIYPFTKEQVREAFTGIPRDRALDILESFNASKLSDLDPANYATVMSEINQIAVAENKEPA